MIEVRKTETFAAWFDGLRDRQARLRVQVRIDRIATGNPGQHRVLSSGVCEMKIDHGPGYRVYYVQRGDVLVVLLCGGDKRTQGKDIEPPWRWHRRWRADMTLKTTPWDSAGYLKTETDRTAYLQACLEEAPGDPAFIAHALGVVARARNMSQLARDTGLTREGLYKALSDEGNPSFGTVLKVINALGYRLKVVREKKAVYSASPTAARPAAAKAAPRKTLKPKQRRA